VWENINRMNVPLIDLRAQFDTIRDEVMAAVERVFESQQFILGQEVETFERAVADYCRVRHAIGCGSGSDALLLALMALGIGAGQEVITVSHSFFATAGCIARLGARPVFVDVNLDDFNLDDRRLERAITQRTAAIIPVHLFGQCAEMDRILEIARRYQLPVIEDAAQAIGAEYHGRRAGTMGVSVVSASFPQRTWAARVSVDC